MTDIRILVCGSREWPGTWEDIGRHFPDLAPEDDVTIIHGACSRLVWRNHGAVGGRVQVQVSVDMLADFVARGLGFAVESYPVDHALDGPWPGAGPRRNARMLRIGAPTEGLAFGALWKPCGTRHSGTGGMVALMLMARLPVRWVATPDAEPVDLVTMPGPTT